MSLVFGSVRQVGYVVRDIEAAMQHWSSELGVGPWFYREEILPIEFRYFGQISRPPRLALAFANSGDLQLELIQQMDDAPSLYRDALARSGEIAQHVAYWTEDRYDEMCHKLNASGYVEGHGGCMAQRGRFAYFVNANVPSVTIELSETTGGKAEFFARIASAARSWDGRSEPIVRL